MRVGANISVWYLCASAAILAGCEPEWVQLEDRVSELGPASAPEEGGLFVIDLMGGARTVRVQMDKLPRDSSSASGTSTVTGGSDDPDDNDGVGASASTWSPGEYEVQVWLNRRALLRETVVAPAHKQSVLLVYADAAHAQRLSLAEVDLSPPEPGLRRARITNAVEVTEPIELYFYDADDEVVGESVSVAWGETWTGTLPSGATGYRLSPTQPVAEPLDRHQPIPLVTDTAADLPCVETHPLGLVVIHRYSEVQSPDGTLYRGTGHVNEVYTYLPPLCYAD